MGDWRRRAALTASGLAVLVLAGGVLALDQVSPVSATRPVAASVVEVPAAASTLVCGGPVRLPASTGDAQFDPAPVSAITSVRGVTSSITASGQLAGTAATGLLADLGSQAEIVRVSPLGGAAGVATLPDVDGASGPVLLTASPADGRSPRIAGTTTSLVTAGDLRGLATASCTAAGSDSWLVGGSTELSSTALLTLANPGSTAASVDLEIWGPNGPVELSGGGAQLVAPGSQRQVLLSGIAAEQRRIVVHVTASGGTVTASLQDDRLNGLTPGGLAIVSAGAAPSARQVVGGIVVPASTIDSEDQAVLRLLVPGTTGTTASISLLGADGLVALPGADSVDLAAGEVVDVPLAGIAAGSYTAVVDAGAPVLAAAMITRIGAPGALEGEPVVDRAWAASEVPGAGGVVALPAVTGKTAATSSSVLLAGIGPDAVDSGRAARGTLRGIAADGTVTGHQDVVVSAGSTLAVPVSDLGAGAVAVDLVPDATTAATASDGGAELAWWVITGVTQSDGELVSVLTPVAPQQAVPAVPVRQAARIGLP